MTTSASIEAMHPGRQPGSGTADHCGVSTSPAGGLSPCLPGRILRRGEHLVRAGEPTGSVCLVRSGALKSYVIHDDGDEQVLGFHMTGDIIGFDAVFADTAACSVVALDTANVARLPMPAAGLVATDGPAHALGGAMYREMQRLTELLYMERASTSERLATFLLDHAERQARRGLSRREFILPMTRRDLAHYLGLAPETLCRAISQFRRDGVIAGERNVIRVLDETALHRCAGREPHCPMQ